MKSHKFVRCINMSPHDISLMLQVIEHRKKSWTLDFKFMPISAFRWSNKKIVILDNILLSGLELLSC